MNFRWGGLGGRAKPSPPEMQVGGGSGGVWGGEAPTHRPASEGPASEGPDSEGPASEGPDSERPASEGPDSEGPDLEGPYSEGFPP